MRALNTAMAARELALVAGLRTEEEAFLAGLLQDIGVMVLAHGVPRLYARALAKARDKLAPSLQVEREHVGTDHVEVARLLFDRWNLPAQLRTPVLYHHMPEKADSADEQTRLAVRIQYVAGRLAEWLYAEDNSDELLEEMSAAAARYLNISPKELEALMCRVDRKVEETAGVFEVMAPRPDSYANLLQKANLALGEIANEQEQLVRQLEAAKEEAQKLSEQLRIANNRLLDEARKDTLTEIPNRRTLQMFLEQELERCARYSHSIALLFIDIDNFKAVNDQYGHLEGDTALRQFASILKHEVRAADIVARYGGEEFIVALVETCQSDAKLAAERIRRAIEKTPIQLSTGRPPLVSLTASLGVSVWEPSQMPINAETLIERADRAMYEAKRAGKNCISAFESDRALVH
jgi:diguanylate cyclase (GGDEF)-like protein